MKKAILNENVGVSCEIYLKNGNKILLSKRGKVFGEGTWALPGGHLEFGETTEKCARRELKEELGIIPKKIKLLGILNDLPNITGQSRQYIRFIFLVEKFEGEITNMEPDRCTALEWFETNKIPSPFFVGHVKVINFIKSKSKLMLTEI